MHNNRIWAGWIVAVMLSASSALAQQAPQQAPVAPATPGAPPAAGAYGQQPQQAYPQPQQAYPAQQQAYPVQGGYPPAQGYPPPQQGYGQSQPQYGQPQYGQQPYYQQPYVNGGLSPRPRRPSRALLITGASIFGASYLISAMVGAILVDADDDGECDIDENCREVGRWLFLPLIGPWVGMSKTRDDGGLAFLGMLQLVGAGLTVGGIIRFVNTKRQYESGIASWEFEQGRKLTLDMSSSPLMAGPRMDFRF